MKSDDSWPNLQTNKLDTEVWPLDQWVTVSGRLPGTHGIITWALHSPMAPCVVKSSIRCLAVHNEQDFLWELLVSSLPLLLLVWYRRKPWDYGLWLLVRGLDERLMVVGLLGGTDDTCSMTKNLHFSRVSHGSGLSMPWSKDINEAKNVKHEECGVLSIHDTVQCMANHTLDTLRSMG